MYLSGYVLNKDEEKRAPSFTPGSVTVGHRDRLVRLESLISDKGKRLNLIQLSSNIETLHPIGLLRFLPIQWLQLTFVVGTGASNNALSSVYTSVL
jgi:hypothetical protein